MILSEFLRKSWEETKKSFWFFFGVLIIYLALSVAAAMLLAKVKFAGQIISILLSFYLSAGLNIIALKKARGEPATIADLFAGLPYLASYAGGYILYMLIVMAGAILLFFPAVIWGIQYQFFPFLVIDKKMKAVQALKASAQMTRGFKWDLLGINFVLGVVGIIGFLCLFIGLFWALPVTMIAEALVYYRFVEKLPAEA